MEKLQWRSEKRKEQKILVDVVEAERVGTDIALPASCERKCFGSGIEEPRANIARITVF